MDSKVVQSQVHENDEHYPNNVSSQQDDHQFDQEKKSVMIVNKVKAKAKKIKDTIKKHGHQVLDRGHDNNNEDHHTLDDRDHDLDEDEEMVEDPEVHATPIHESEVVKTATPTSEQVKNREKSGINFGGTKVMGEEPHHDPLVEGVSSTIEIDQSIATDPAKIFSVEEKAGLPKENLEGPIGLKEDPHTPGSRPEAYTPPNYQTKVIDPSGAASDETEITPVEESFARIKVNDEPKRTPESNIQPTAVDSEYPPAGSHDQFVPHFSDATQTQYPSAETHDQFSPGSRSELYNSPNYQTKPSDPRGAGSDEIEITTDEESFARMDVHDEPKPTLEPNVQPSVTNSDYPRAEIHDQFVPHLSAETQTKYPSDESQDQISQETVSKNINRKLENPTETEQTFNTIKTTGEERPHYEANTDKVVSPKKATTSDVGVGEKGDIKDKVITNEEAQYPSAESHDQISQETVSTNISRNLENPTETEQTFNTIKTTAEERPHYEANTTSELGVGEKGDIKDKVTTKEEAQYPSAESHDQISQETVSTNSSRNLENPTETEQTFNTIKTTVEEQPHYEANTDKVVSPKNATISEVGVGERGDINDKVTAKEEAHKSENASTKSGSTAEYGKNVAQSLTQKLAPVYEKVAGVGSAVKSKVTGTSTGGGVGTEAKNEAKEQEKGVSVKDYLAEKLRPSEEDKALSEVISEALHKGKEEPVKNEPENLVSGDEKSEKASEESSVNSPGKGVVGKLKGVVGSWFGKSEENQSSQGGEDLSKNANYGAEQVSQVVDENKTSPIEEQVTR